MRRAYSRTREIAEWVCRCRCYKYERENLVVLLVPSLQHTHFQCCLVRVIVCHLHTKRSPVCVCVRVVLCQPEIVAYSGSGCCSHIWKSWTNAIVVSSAHSNGHLLSKANRPAEISQKWNEKQRENKKTNRTTRSRKKEAEEEEEELTKMSGFPWNIHFIMKFCFYEISTHRTK